MNTCRHKFVPSDSNRINTIEESKLDEDGKWHCPHAVSGDKDFCPFHSPDSNKEDISQEFKRIVHGELRDWEEYESPERRLEFIDASFEEFTVQYTTLSTNSNFPVDLRYSTFLGRFDISHSQIQQPLKLDGCDFENGLLAVKTTFHNELDLRDARISEFSEEVCYDVTAGRTQRVIGGCGFPGSRFLADARFTYSQFDIGTFYNSLFQGEIEFTNVMISTALDIEMSTIDGTLKIDGTKVQRLLLTSTICNREVFVGVDEINKVNMENAIFNKSVIFRDNRLSSFNSNGASFKEKLIIKDITFDDTIAIHEANINKLSVISPESGQNISELSFKKSKIKAGEIELFKSDRSPVPFSNEDTVDHNSDIKNNEIVVNLSNTTISEVDFHYANNSVWKYIILDETKFDGFEFQNYIDDLEVINYNIHISSQFAESILDDPSIEYNSIKVKHSNLHKSLIRILQGVKIPRTNEITKNPVSTFLQAKNGASQAGDVYTASEFFIREYYFRQQQAKEKMKRATARSENKMRSFLRWASYAFLATTSVYGERARRVAGFSVAIILFFSVIYSIVWMVIATGPQPPYDGPGGALLLSIESFTTLVHGGTVVMDPIVRLIADVEGFLGAFFIALFVFTLTRSIHR